MTTCNFIMKAFLRLSFQLNFPLQSSVYLITSQYVILTGITTDITNLLYFFTTMAPYN